MRVQVRNGKVIIDGYVNAVERDSKVLYDNRGKFIEKIRAGTFQKALERTDNVDVLFMRIDDLFYNTKSQPRTCPVFST